MLLIIHADTIFPCILEELEKSMQLHRTSAMKDLMIANTFLQKVEAKKEAHIMRLRQKKAMSKLNPLHGIEPCSKSPVVRPLVKEYERRYSMWSIDSCLSNDFNARMASRDSLPSQSFNQIEIYTSKVNSKFALFSILIESRSSSFFLSINYIFYPGVKLKNIVGGCRSLNFPTKTKIQLYHRSLKQNEQ